jgi:hypothetical protein
MMFSTEGFFPALNSASSVALSEPAVSTPADQERESQPKIPAQIGRLADAFGFLLPGPKAFEAGAKYLLARGYR